MAGVPPIEQEELGDSFDPKSVPAPTPRPARFEDLLLNPNLSPRMRPVPQSTISIRDPEFNPVLAFKAALHQNNMFSSAIRDFAFSKAIENAEQTRVGPPVDPWQVSQYANAYPVVYAGLTSLTAIQIADRQIEGELLDAEIIASNGWAAALGMVGAAFVDPLQFLFPLGRLKTGIGFLQGASRAALPAFTSNIIDEIIISGGQVTRPLDESALNVLMAGGIVGIFGGAAGHFGHDYTNRLVLKHMKNMEEFQANGGPKGYKEAPTGRNVVKVDDDADFFDETRPRFKSAGAAAVDENMAAKTDQEIRDGEGLASAFGLEKLPDIPYKRLMYSPLIITREFTSMLVESPGTLQKKNFALEATPHAVETLIAPWNFKLFDGLRKINELYAEYRDLKLGASTSSQILGLAKLAAKDLVGGRDGKLSPSEFRQEISRALGDKEQHENPFVQKGAVEMRLVLNELRDQGIEHDIFTAAQRSKSAAKSKALVIDEAAYKKTVDEIIVLQKTLRQKEIKATATHGPRSDDNAQGWAGVDKLAKRIKKMRARASQMKKNIRSTKTSIQSLQDEIKAIREEGPTVFDDEGYFPRIWRIDKIEANMDVYRRVIGDWLTSKGVPAKELENELARFLELIRRDHNYIKPIDHDPGIARSARARVVDLPNSAVWELIETDIDAIMRSHVRSFATDLELVKKFGTVDLFEQTELIRAGWAEKIAEAPAKDRPALAKKAKKEIDDWLAMRDRLRGTYGLPEDPYRLQSRFYRVMKQWNYLTFLGGVVLSALPDAARPIMTEGLERTFGTSYALLKASPELRRLVAKENNMSGVALDMIMNTRAMQMADMGDVFGRQSGLERTLHATAEAFSMFNLLNPWNTFVKEWAGAIVASRIFEAADLFIDFALVKGKKIPFDFVKLARSGIDKPMAKRIMKEFYLHGDIAFLDGKMMSDLLEGLSGKERQAAVKKAIARARKQGAAFLANTDAWTDLDAITAFRAAIKQDVDKTIVTPGAADRPLWMSTEMGSVIGQFKGFAVASAQRVLLSALQEKQAYNIHGFAMMVAMGIVVNELKNNLSGYDSGPESTAQTILGGIDRSGVLGYFNDIDRAIEALTGGGLSVNGALGGRRGEQPARHVAGSLLGPSASKLLDIRRLLADGSQGTFDEGTAGAAIRIIPFQSHFALTALFDKAQQQFR